MNTNSFSDGSWISPIEVISRLQFDLVKLGEELDSLKVENDGLKARIATLEAQVKVAREGFYAANRVRINDYARWHNTGGPNECPHGYAEGIPCLLCDVETCILAEEELAELDRLDKEGRA